MGKQLTHEEREAYMSSFAEAMREVEEYQKAAGVEGKAYRELKREGLWDAETIMLAYVASVGGFSSLSSRLRKYILNLGALAKQKFDKRMEEKGEAEGQTKEGQE